MKKATKLIESIGEIIVENIMNLDEAYELVNDGDYKGRRCSTSFVYDCGNVAIDVECVVNVDDRYDKAIQCFICDKNVPTFENALTEYVKSKIDIDTLSDIISDYCSTADYDEWNEHGFRDEQDYIHWKYG